MPNEPDKPIPAHIPAGVVDACASRIADPVSRLNFLRRSMREPERKPSRPRWSLAVPVAAVLLIVTAWPTSLPHERSRPRPAATPRQLAVAPATPDVIPNVWLVERKGSTELYSNGLLIEDSAAGPDRPRAYRAFLRSSPDGAEYRLRTDPAGIVFHSSEGDLVEFRPELNRALKRQVEGLVAYAQRRQCYHFVIDRFGQVHRVVREGSRADHAGHSLWADDTYIYAGLNQSFLAVAFEAQSHTGTGVSPAQVHAAKVLTEMLRSRYRIPARNCVTHAQVSVNPGNFGIGYHTDWASGFPFSEIGLPDNYEQIPASLLFFGFEADSSYVALAGEGLRAAVAAAEERVRLAAEAQKTPVERYRAGLRKQYARIAAAAGGPTAE